MKRVASVAVTLWLCSHAGVSAHDFWLAVDPPLAAGAQKVTLTANVGDHFPTSTSFTAPDRVEKWHVIGAAGELPVTRAFRNVETTVKDKVVPTSLATDVALPVAGAYLGVMTVAARVTEMKGPEFTDYLKEEGLDRIVATRAAAGEADKAARERYARYAKIALRNGAGGGDHLTRAVGLRAEFIPAADPTMLRPGQSLTVQLVADGKPVSDAAVTAVSDDKGPGQTARTDANGRVSLALDHDAAWLIKTVHMAKSAQADADWESYWVTLVFHTAK